MHQKVTRSYQADFCFNHFAVLPMIFTIALHGESRVFSVTSIVGLTSVGIVQNVHSTYIQVRITIPAVGVVSTPGGLKICGLSVGAQEGRSVEASRSKPSIEGKETSIDCSSALSSAS